MVESDIRREKLLDILKNSSAPVSGSALARQLGVSRQVIVQDIALLRARQCGNLCHAEGLYFIYAGSYEKIPPFFYGKSYKGADRG